MLHPVSRDVSGARAVGHWRSRGQKAEGKLEQHPGVLEPSNSYQWTGSQFPCSDGFYNS